MLGSNATLAGRSRLPRRSTVWAVALGFAAFLAVAYAATRGFLLHNYVALERESCTRDVRRVLSALADDLEGLSTFAYDYAVWNETYRFMADGNAAYVASNLAEGTFRSAGISFMVYVSPDGRVMLSKGYDSQKRQWAPVSADLVASLSADSPLVKHAASTSVVGGVVLLPDGPVLTVSRPILTSDEKGPSRGALVLGRHFGAARVRQLAARTHLTFTIRQSNDPKLPDDFRRAVRALNAAAPIFIDVMASNRIAGYTWIPDVYGKPALMVRVDEDRSLYRQGRQSVLYFLVALGTVGLLFVGTTGWILGRFILFRLRVEEHLAGSLKEKEALLQEIHHRVKNNLQIVSSLLSLQARATGNDEAAAILRESQSRVRTMGIIHDELYQDTDISHIVVGEYVRRLAKHVVASISASPDQITLHVDTDDSLLDMEDAVACGIIVNELVSNTVKHAFPKGTPGTIAVSFRRDASGRCVLQVADNGIGSAEPIDTQNTSSLGLRLVKTLVGQIGGTFDIQQADGTLCSITFHRPLAE